MKVDVYRKLVVVDFVDEEKGWETRVYIKNRGVFTISHEMRPEQYVIDFSNDREKIAEAEKDIRERPTNRSINYLYSKDLPDKIVEETISRGVAANEAKKALRKSGKKLTDLLDL